MSQRFIALSRFPALSLHVVAVAASSSETAGASALDRCRALEAIQQYRPELLLTDLGMPR